MTIEIGLVWLLIVPAVAFALGWLACRLDLRQQRRESRDSPRAYYKGLNLLLNEQQDKAIDAFIEAVQNDPDTTELHFALGNLFRRRGEFERSVRVHQHLLSRTDLAASDRQRAQHALAQDFAKAGLFDRAEQAFRALTDSAYATQARQALLDLYERARDWPAAQAMAAELQASGVGSYAGRIAHHLCEEAAQAMQQGQWAVAAARVDQAHEASALSARPLVMRGQILARQGLWEDALAAWSALLPLPQAPVALVAAEIAEGIAAQAGEPGAQAQATAVRVTRQALTLLKSAYEAHKSIEVLQAINTLEPQNAGAALARHLESQPSLSAAAALLRHAPAHWQDLALAQIQRAVERSALPLQRYRCAACGFEAQRYFWQCPGCLSWDSYPPERLEEL